MDRREWLRNAALIASGIVAADQLEILEKLNWKRKFFNSINLNKGGFIVQGDFARLFTPGLRKDFIVAYSQLNNEFEANWFKIKEDESPTILGNNRGMA